MIAPLLKWRGGCFLAGASHRRWRLSRARQRPWRFVLKQGSRLKSSRSDTPKGFTVLPKRWIVERTFGWFGRCRRLAKDFENLSRSHAAFVILAMIRIMLQRIVRLSQTS